MSTLTEEQRRRIKENREKALAKRNLGRNGHKIYESKVNCFTNQIAGNDSLSSVNSKSTNFDKNHKKIDQHTFPIFRAQSSNKDVSSELKTSVNSSSSLNSQVPSLKQGQRNGRIFTATCSLLSKSRFVVKCGYHHVLQEIFKTIPSRAYDVKTKKWNFHINDLDQLLKAVKPLQPAVAFGGVPTFVFQLLKATYDEQDYSLLDSISPSVRNALLPFQADGVRFGISRQGRVLLADDMGLGKTIQAISIVDFYRQEWPVLCVAPSSVRYAWSQAFKNWLPHLAENEVFMVNSNKDIIRKSAKVIIISYDLLTRQSKEISQLDYKVIIMDESHFVKNVKSARTRAAQEVSKNCKRLILLSGTPALSRPSELFSQLNMLNRKFFSNYTQFGIRYCNGKKVPWGNGWDFKGSSNMKELQILLTNSFMIRRLKSTVMSELPSKQRNMIILDPNLIEKKNSKMEMAEKRMHLKSSKGTEKHGALLQYFSETSFAKLKAVSNYIEDLVEGSRKFLCFAHHQIMIDHICASLTQKKVKFIRIDGHTSSEKRKELCDSFQVKDYQVAVLSITAANVGITLTAADLVVFAELFWNPGILTQAEDRAHRIGQVNLVNVQYLVAKGTADDFLWALVQKKLDVLNKAGLSKDNFTDSNTTLKVNSNKQPSILEFLKDIGDDFFNDESFDECVHDSKKIKVG
ncbi:SWI/SNF-related matrix-associated actin-dependent regulator of chromatin subfamily A-like protein 1 [Nymphon striatum]|nr:SWI/SNF-related matrix-associated actin-dependent regulator of chromatin subfamily A-like protein 1 [Nymphon striatum]